MKLDKDIYQSIIILLIVVLFALPVYHFVSSDDGLEPVEKTIETEENVNPATLTLDQLLEMLRIKTEEQGLLTGEEGKESESDTDIVEIIENSLDEVVEIIKPDEVESIEGENDVEVVEAEEIAAPVNVVVPKFLSNHEMTMEEICQEFTFGSVPSEYFPRFISNCSRTSVASEYSANINLLDGSILTDPNYLLWRRQY